MIKILSWNIRQGGGSRLTQIVGAIKTINAHILVLTEYRNNDRGSTLRAKLLALGYRYQAVTASSADDNSVIMASMIPFDASISDCPDASYPHNVLIGKYKASVIYGGYFPHKKKHTLFDWVVDEVKNRTAPIIICGDLNTGKNYVDQKKNSFWYEDQFIELTQELGKDAYRHIHEDKLEYSWYSHQGNGYRYDHTIVTPDLVPIVSNCYYLQDYREQKISDHAPMVLELG